MAPLVLALAMATAVAVGTSIQEAAVRADGGFALSARAPVLDPEAFRSFSVALVDQISHDTRKLTISLPQVDDDLGLTAASYIVVQAEVEGKAETRAYTPTSPEARRGSFDLVVKVYEQGKVSK